MIKPTKEQRGLLLKEVHCTKYLRQKKCDYYLKLSEQTDYWYYSNYNDNNKSIRKATRSPLTWKYNLIFELKEKEFSGVVTRITEMNIAKLLGLINNNITNELPALCTFPKKIDVCSILVATVYYGNNRKRLVPLECIKESKKYTDGYEIEKMINNIKSVNNDEINTISFHSDGSVQIGNTSFFLDLSAPESPLSRINRYIMLNPVKNVSRIFTDDDDDGYFNISDSEYLTIMSYMKKSMKEECGFEPSSVYGDTNYERLLNFAAFPFAPEVNAFCKLFDESFPWFSLNSIHEGVKAFITLCGIPYTPQINKIFLKGHLYFAEFLGLWNCGFKDIETIQQIMITDTYFFFAKAVFQYGAIGINGFRFENKPLPLIHLDFLHTLYNSQTVAKLLMSVLQIKSELGVSIKLSFKFSDTVSYMYHLSQENALSEDVIKKIKKEGFTKYNHDMLMRSWNELHPEQEDVNFENQIIEYSDLEKQLEWKNENYHFLIPNDTATLRKIGAQMSICVGHLYSNKAVEKRCTIVYALKNEKYQLCMELQKKEDNTFHLVQVSAFSNHKPKGQDLEAFKKWILAKKIV